MGQVADKPADPASAVAVAEQTPQRVLQVEELEQGARAARKRKSRTKPMSHRRVEEVRAEAEVTLLPAIHLVLQAVETTMLNPLASRPLCPLGSPPSIGR